MPIKTLGRLAALTAAMLLAVPAAVRAAGNAGEQAADFPPGLFTDGGRYQLSDFAGKVVVLFFYEKDCPSCRGKIPDRNKVVQQFQGKPVVFFAVAAGDTLQQAKSYAGGTRLAMPVFADPLSVMTDDLEHRPEIGILLALTEDIDESVLRRWLRAQGPKGRSLRATHAVPAAGSTPRKAPDWPKWPKVAGSPSR